jgi:DNA polymerase-3 subunit epsilon
MGTWPSPLTLLDELAFTFVDVETTGLDPATGDRVCEIALLRVQGDREIARFESLVHPQRPMHPGALAVHGITDAMLVGAPIFATLLPQIHALLQDAVLVAHNARFDMSFLRHEWQLAGHTFPFLAVADTLALAQARYRFPHNSLGAIASELGVTPTALHRAMADVCTTWQVALPTGKPLLLRYQPEKAPATVRVVQPLEVYYERGHGYIRAFCHLRQEERHFRLDRIAELTMLPEG